MNDSNYIQIVRNRLKTLGYNILFEDYYTHIYNWLNWYKGYVKEFHDYKMYNGVKFVNLKLHSLGLPKTFSERWASILYNDKTAISMKEDDKDAQDVLDDVLKQSMFPSQFTNTLELAFALGTSATVVYKKQDKKVGINHIYAPMIEPLRYENGEIVDCAFASIVSKDSYYINIHTKQPNGEYKIINDFFKINVGTKGKIKEEELEMKGIVKEYTSPVKMFQIYKPNIVNKLEIFNPMGMSAFENALDQIKAADYAYDSFVNEFRLGKKKIFVPIDTLQYKQIVQADGKEASVPIFDEDQTEYYALPGDDNNKSEMIHEYNPDIRLQEHQEGIQLAVNLAGMNAGFGENYFTFKDGKVYTNTAQVISSNSEFYKNIVKNENMLRISLTELAKAAYWAYTGKEYDGDITVDFDTSVIEDADAKKKQAILELSNELIDDVQYYIDIYGMTEKQAIEFRDKIAKRKVSDNEDSNNDKDPEDEDDTKIDEE